MSVRAALVLSLAVAFGLGRVESMQTPTPAADIVEPAPIAPGHAPAPGEYSPAFDALHYDIRVTLPLQGAVVTGRTEIHVAIRQNAPDRLSLDFTGLAVTRVLLNGSVTRFSHDNGKLTIPLSRAQAARGSRLRIVVDYRGTPDNGLIIRNNIHHQRAAFADNWPNRARFWFPALDYPADKATASFTVLVPVRWTVVANGLPEGAPTEVRNPDGTRYRRYRWRITEPISPYNMVIGAGEMVVNTVGRACTSPKRCVDVTTWLFPDSAAKAAPSFRRAVAMVDYFSQVIAPFPYRKLAHVQSSTLFDGMENATAIFYPEKPLSEGQNIESTVAHETAHQWFGDAVTEKDWHHLWLSEGFATYFAVLFYEHVDGASTVRPLMESARKTVVESPLAGRPIVDPGQTNLFELLNANNYEKGSWVLHMLRGMIGDKAFFDGIRRYYQAHMNGTADTADFRRAMELAAGIPLDAFFDQWVFRPGFPKFRVATEWNAALRTTTVIVEQIQPADWPTFRLPLAIALTTTSGTVRQQVQLTQRLERFTLPTDLPSTRVVVDPDDWILKTVEYAPDAGFAAR